MIHTFYKPEMAPAQRVGFSQSPQKPRLMMEWLDKNELSEFFPIAENWEPFEEEDFLLAHSKQYVKNFFMGKEPDASSNGLSWNEDFANSVRYTNASLFYAMEHSVLQSKVAFSPTSGFHHATPRSGSCFCSFSGQVIASMKIWNKYRIAGAYMDLDGHFGNSIEDSMFSVPNLNEAIRMNVNPRGKHESYIDSVKREFEKVIELIINKEIGYIVLCSGADSLVDDDLGGNVNLEEWLSIKNHLYSTLAEFDTITEKFPTLITLFGGYRSDHYECVLDAHTLDLVSCLDYRFATHVDYESVYRNQ